jgi:beta-galactosidase
MKHDIMRGLKGGQSFVLTEQSPNQQNWQPYNKLKRPGEVRLLSYQALAHGADTVLFFQMRQSIAGQEKFHGAIISHAGHENTRVFRESEVLGHELEKLGDVFLQGRSPAKVAILMDWNNWWALELTSGPNKDMDYLNTLSRYYKPFHDRNIPVDIVNPAADTDYSGYDLVVAPMLYMTKEGVGEKLTEYVREGGTLVTTVMSGLVDENDRCIFGEYPGKLRDVLGIWVEEVDALKPEERNHIVMDGAIALPRESYECSFLCDLLHPLDKLLSFHGIQRFYPGEMFGREGRNSFIGELSSGHADRVSDGEHTRVEHADDIACVGFIHYMSCLRHHLLGLGKPHPPVPLHMIYFLIRIEFA